MLKTYTFVIVNVPLAAQLVEPVTLHEPEIVPPFTVPFRTSVSFDGLPDAILN